MIFFCGQGKYVPPRQEDEENVQKDSDMSEAPAYTCYTNSEEASPVKNAICIFPFLFDANGDGKAEEHNTCIEVAEGGWCSTHVDQEGQFQEGRWGYCQRKGCEFRTPALGPSSSPTPSTTLSLPSPVTSTLSSTVHRLPTTLPPPVTAAPLPLLQLPILLPPPGTPISIPCGMFNPIQAALPVHLRSC